MYKESILIFGVGPLQKSLIERCKLKGLYTVGIDPMDDAVCKDDVDAFEVVAGQDFEKTLEVAQRYKVKGIITAATDKPLIMMARVAERLDLPFFSVETAEWSTDKLLMKQKFMKFDIPCAKGFLLNNIYELDSIKIDYPVIVKPRDNSGSRGVLFCKNILDVKTVFSEVKQYTQKESILVEEYIDGKEYSIESLHFNGQTKVIQYTEKITTPHPYNVEVGHIQPADLSLKTKEDIKLIITGISETLGFINCASHTELKINKKGIYIIETSPRLGGDYITSHLVPLSTGVNMEDQLIDIAIGNKVNYMINNWSSMISYLNFTVGKRIIKTIKEDEMKNKFHAIQLIRFDLKPDDEINIITNSLNRYGFFIIDGENSDYLLELNFEVIKYIDNYIFST